MAEFSIIDQFCRDVGPKHRSTKLDIGDDAAVIQPDKGSELAISVDTMVSGVHFFEDVRPEALAHKILAVNLSDMAAMGARPKWATLALTLSSVDAEWLRAFSDSLKTMASRFGVQLIGGDTTQGQLSLSLTIIGLLPLSKSLRRSGAKLGHDVYVTGTLGDAALGLALLNKEFELSSDSTQWAIAALEIPEPRVQFGSTLLDLASSCLDVSDGLAGDLAHICNQSAVSIEIDLESLPLSSAYHEYLALLRDDRLSVPALNYALNGGDDYELAFTAAPRYEADIRQVASECGLAVTKIGQVIERDSKTVYLRKNQERIAGDQHSGNSFEHFQV